MNISLNAFVSAMSRWEVLVFISILIVWSVIWKGLALWKAARLSHKGWFIALCIVNTAGILEIIYLLTVAGGKVHEHPGVRGQLT